MEMIALLIPELITGKSAQSLHEQLSLTVRWVSADYVVHEDFIGMYDCPKTDAE